MKKMMSFVGGFAMATVIASFVLVAASSREHDRELLAFRIGAHCGVRGTLLWVVWEENEAREEGRETGHFIKYADEAYWFVTDRTTSVPWTLTNSLPTR